MPLPQEQRLQRTSRQPARLQTGSKPLRREGFRSAATAGKHLRHPDPSIMPARGGARATAAGRGIFVEYAACVAVYKDAKRSPSDQNREFAPSTVPCSFEHHTTSLVFNDPPLHTRVRKIIAGAFTPRSISDMEQPVTELVDGLLDAIEAKGSADLVADLAAAVPVEVIGNLLAVPREERGPLREWSLAILGAGAVLSPISRRTASRRSGFLAYLGRWWRGGGQAGDPERDVLTRLIQARRTAAAVERELLHKYFILNAATRPPPTCRQRLYALLEWLRRRHADCASPAIRRRRGVPALREPQSVGNRLTTAPVEVEGVAIRPAPTSPSVSAPRTAIPASFPSQIGWISRASPTVIWPSAPGRMCASASTWRGWKGASPSAGSSRASLVIG